MSRTEVVTQMVLTMNEDSYLNKAFTTDTLLQIRTGTIKPFYHLPSPSAIFKNPRSGSLKITKLGAEDDEQAYKLHGGPDKALLHYCSQHYARWQREIPESAHSFTVGAFGENVVSASANERNVCLGDVISIGDEVLVQVSEPRMPCYKLNHRLQISDMSRRSQDMRRTGWYYRVLREGYVKAGDGMRLVSRPNPKWTVANVQHYLHKEMKNFKAMRELANLPELGLEIKTLFENRLRRNFENENGRLIGDESDRVTTWRDIRITEKKRETSRIFSFVLEAVQSEKHDQHVEPGSHIRLKLPGKLVRAYSVVGGTSNKFQIGVALDSNSKGGSRFLHKEAKVGDVFSSSQIVPSFPLSTVADSHVLIAGGIGITAFLAAAKSLHNSGQTYVLHLAVRSREEIPFRDELDKFDPNVKIHDKSASDSLDLLKIISNIKGNAHLYCCGPPRLMEAVASTAAVCGIPSAQVHFEAFQIEAGGDPFTVEAVKSQKKLEVGSNQTLLQVLQDAGIDVSSSCETGNCGTCRVNICAGKVEHRGTGLLETEKASMMLSCVSRGLGHIVIEA